MRIHENDYITDPDFHDGYLTGIRVIDESVLELYCTHMDGPRYVLRIPGLNRLKVDNFLQGNIIFEISVLTDNEIPQENLKALCGYDNPYYEDRFPAFYNKVCTEGWTFVTIGSSYGCELEALFEVGFERFELVCDTSA